MRMTVTLQCSAATAAAADVAAGPCGLSLPEVPDLLERLRSEPVGGLSRLAACLDAPSCSLLMQCAVMLGLGPPGGRRSTFEAAVEVFGPQRTVDLFGVLTLVGQMQMLANRRDGAGGPCTSWASFWSHSLNRARVLAWLARRHGSEGPDLALAFGLLCDSAVALMMLELQTPSYRVTLAEANLGHRPVTEVERGRHGTDHAEVAGRIAAGWGFDAGLARAVGHHHDDRALTPQQDERVRTLVALGLVADRMTVRPAARHRQHVEWQRGGTMALHVLGMSAQDYEDWLDEVNLHSVLNGRG
ncbi:MAG: hypothetical protein RLZZ592_805 [Pseudomonadota bacterium]|jgi:hypothetical protein